MVQIDDLRDKVVLITGASGGIGAALCRAFAAQRARLVMHWHGNRAAAESLLAEIRGAGCEAMLVQGDLTAPGAAASAVTAGIQAFGALDVLVNNAGALIERRPFLDADDDFIDRVFDLNARSAMAMCRAAIPHLERSGRGAIINVGSIAGLDGGGPGAGVYGCAKAFVHNLTRHLARDLAVRHIRVNTVSPGVVDTAFHAATPAERMEAMRKSVPLGRIGSPADCIGAFLFLASASLSGYVTGQNIHVNGGQVMP